MLLPVFLPHTLLCLSLQAGSVHILCLLLSLCTHYMFYQAISLLSNLSFLFFLSLLTAYSPRWIESLCSVLLPCSTPLLLHTLLSYFQWHSHCFLCLLVLSLHNYCPP